MVVNSFVAVTILIILCAGIGTVAGIITVTFINALEDWQVDEIDISLEDLNGKLGFSNQQPPIVSCPAAPDCICTASCAAKARVFEACHIPERFFNRPSTFKSYSGLSNIPSIFGGNVLETVGVGEKDKLLAGCFYGFDYEDEEYLHRLAGIYPDYLLFQGDNNDGFERVDRDAVKYLLLGVMYK